MLACFAFCQVPFRRKADLGYKRRGWQPDSQTLSCQLAWQLALVGLCGPCGLCVCWFERVLVALRTVCLLLSFVGSLWPLQTMCLLVLFGLSGLVDCVSADFVGLSDPVDSVSDGFKGLCGLADRVSAGFGVS